LISLHFSGEIVPPFKSGLAPQLRVFERLKSERTLIDNFGISNKGQKQTSFSSLLSGAKRDYVDTVQMRFIVMHGTAKQDEHN
jgi:hypothetical protein